MAARRNSNLGSKLTPKQLLFVNEYLIDLNATQAAIRAGYSKKTASAIGDENLRKPGIKQVIDLLKEKRIAKVQVDAQWVLEKSINLHNRCAQEEEVTDKDGNRTGEYKFEHSGVAKALELIGKHVSVQSFKEQIELTRKKVIIKDMAGGKFADD